MKEEKDPSFEQNDPLILIERFEKMVADDELYFFDVEQFEEIMDHYVERGKINLAFKVLNFARLQHPSSLDFTLREAELLAISNNPKEALLALDKVEAFEKGNPDFFLTKASIYSQMGAYRKAIEFLERAAELSGRNKDEVFVSLSFEYQNLEDYAEAIKYLQKALQANPKNEDALYELAYCLDQVSDDGSAGIKFYKAFTDEYPYSSHAWYNLGNSYCKAQLLEKALEAYDFTLVIKEDFSGAYFNKANVLMGLGRYKDAIETYKETLQYELFDALTYYYMGECYEKLEDYPQAYRYYTKSTKSDPYLSDAWLGMGIVLDQQDRVVESIHCVKKAIEIDEQNPDYWYVLGELEQKLGFTDEAKQAYEKVTVLDENNDEIWLDYSHLMFLNERIDEAFDVITRGIKILPDNSKLHYRLAAYLLSRGLETEGLAALQHALLLAPKEYSELTDYFPAASNNGRVLDLIETFKYC